MALTIMQRKQRNASFAFLCFMGTKSKCLAIYCKPVAWQPLLMQGLPDESVFALQCKQCKSPWLCFPGSACIGCSPCFFSLLCLQSKDPKQAMQTQAMKSISKAAIMVCGQRSKPLLWLTTQDLYYKALLWHCLIFRWL